MNAHRRTAELTRAAVAGLCALALLAACGGGSKPAAGSAKGRAASSAPSANAIAPAAPLPPTAAAALGDLRTLDPCSLVDLSALTAASGGRGAATFGDPQSLDYCVVKLTAATGPVELHVGELVSANPAAGGVTATQAPRRTQQLTGGQQLVQGAPGSAACADQLVFTDQVALLAAAAPTGSAATAATCTLADAGLRVALSAVAAGRVTHRTDPKGSFGPVDACAALPAAAVGSVVPAAKAAAAVHHPAGHQCEFGDPGSSYVALVLGAAYARFDGGPTSTTVRTAGHRVVLVPDQPDGRAGECVGYGPHLGFTGRSGQPAIEMAELHVALPAPATSATACGLVRRLASSVFARLP